MLFYACARACAYINKVYLIYRFAASLSHFHVNNMKNLDIRATFCNFATSNLRKQTNKKDKNMKQIVISLIIMLTATLSVNATSVADKVEDEIKAATEKIIEKNFKHRHHRYDAKTEEKAMEVDSVAIETDEGVTAFSDTTDTELADDTTAVYAQTNSGMDDDDFDFSDFRHIGLAESILILIIVFIVIGIPVICFFTLPILIIWLVTRNRRRRERERFAYMQAMAQNGKDVTPNVDNVKKEKAFTRLENNKEYNQGKRNVCLGLGLFLMLWFITRTMGVASIGLLVMCIGAGQMWTSKKRSEPADDFSANTTSTDNYDKTESTAAPEAENKEEVKQ